MDVFISTGESSGDFLASDVVRELQRLSHKPLDIAGIIGPETKKLGVRDLGGYFGNAGVVTDGVKYWINIYAPLRDMLNRDKPRVFLAVTHQIFNIALAGDLPRETYKVLMGPPEIWAWRMNWFGKLVLPLAIRVLMGRQKSHLVRIVAHRGRYALDAFDRLCCMFPMNHRAYQNEARSLGVSDEGVSDVVDEKVKFIGHRFMDVCRNDSLERQSLALRGEHGIDKDARVLGLFPGSRSKEIELLLPDMLHSATQLLDRDRDTHVIIALADARYKCPSKQAGQLLINKSVQEMIADASDSSDIRSRIHISADSAMPALCASDYTILCSGTVTLLASLLGVPGAVVYRFGSSFIMRIVMRMFVSKGKFSGKAVPYALPNAILACLGKGKKQQLYREFIQFGTISKMRFQSKLTNHLLSDFPASSQTKVSTPQQLPTPETVMQIRELIKPDSCDMKTEPNQELCGSISATLVARSILEHL